MEARKLMEIKRQLSEAGVQADIKFEAANRVWIASASLPLREDREAHAFGKLEEDPLGVFYSAISELRERLARAEAALSRAVSEVGSKTEWAPGAPPGAPSPEKGG